MPSPCAAEFWESFMAKTEKFSDSKSALFSYFSHSSRAKCSQLSGSGKGRKEANGRCTVGHLSWK
jgi:hypothetical protein